MSLPVFRSGDDLPDWGALRFFAVHSPGLNGALRLDRRAGQGRLMITRGRCHVASGGMRQVLRAGQFHDLPDGAGGWDVTGTTPDAEVLELSGDWGHDIAGCGIWTLENEEGATDAGDPVDYPKRTRMDSHFHDYDEYWFVLDGAATAVVGGVAAALGAGDCVAIGAGFHHDMPDVRVPMRGAFFETGLIGEGRLGHLWEHTHGRARPDPAKEFKAGG